MQIWMTLTLALQLLAALAMIGLVLIQHGKGADMGASFGSGASGSLFGATGSANFLSRSTAACATIFFVCTLVLAYFGTGGAKRGDSGSVLDRPAASASAAASGAASGAAGPAVIPTAPAPAAAPAASAVQTPTTAPGAIPAAPGPTASAAMPTK